jgi:predicted TIM-barrel fold metal-dependent hydrolase
VAYGHSAAAEPLPIVDAHLHYSQDAWTRFPPAAILALMDRAGVTRAFVSSTPDDGTVALHGTAPARFVPFLRPYRGTVNSSNWTEDPTLLPYLEQRLRSGIYRGIGEFHLAPGGAEWPNVRKVVALAVAQGLYLQVHSGADPVRGLFAADPRVKVLWAHAGMSEPPGVVGPLLAQHAQLWCELSFRAGDIAPGGRLDPAWRALFERFPERFLIGTDTYLTERFDEYADLIGQHRQWLAQLPAPLAEAIAYRNAARLLGETQ